MKENPLSIKSILIITISILTLLVSGFALKETYIEGNRMLRIQSLREANTISDKLFEFTEKSSMVRDITSFILYAPDQATIDKLRPQLTETRLQADAALNAVVESLQGYHDSGFTKNIEDIKTEFIKLKKTRAAIDKEIALPMSQRKRDAAELWFGEATDIIQQNQKIWIEFMKYYSDIDPAVTLHMRFKHFLGVIIEYTGRERAVIGRLIVQNAVPTPQEQANILRWHGSVEMGWERIDSLAEQSGLNPVINPYIKDAKSHYITVYEMVRDIFYVPAVKQNTPYPISVEFWLEISSQATDSIYELKNAALQQTYNYVGTLEYKAKEAIVINIILLIISIGLCFYSFWIINFRVIYPINYMVSALLDATRGNQVRINPAMIARNDEIGKLGQVLSILQKTNERYRALVEASSKIIWIWMPGEQDSGMAALHKWWEEVTGQPGGEMHDFGWLKVVHPDDREYMKKAWSESSTLGKEFKVEHRLITKKGTYRHVSVRGVPLKNEDGSVREVVGALNDITDRKEAEIQLKLYMQDLERSNKELDDFAYIASHDLKEPLRGIHNHARFLLEDNQEKLEEDSVKRLGRLIYLSQRMERLVNDLLYFSRLGRQELAIGKTDINDIITDIENTIDVFLKDHNAKILIPKKLPQKITCDTTRITEVFRNLITNAVKYNDKAAKTVEIGFLEKYTAKDGEILLIPHNIS